MAKDVQSWPLYFHPFIIFLLPVNYLPSSTRFVVLTPVLGRSIAINQLFCTLNGGKRTPPIRRR